MVGIKKLKSLPQFMVTVISNILGMKSITLYCHNTELHQIYFNVRLLLTVHQTAFEIFVLPNKFPFHILEFSESISYQK